MLLIPPEPTEKKKKKKDNMGSKVKCKGLTCSLLKCCEVHAVELRSSMESDENHTGMGFMHRLCLCFAPKMKKIGL